MFYLFLFIDLAILRVGAEQNGLQGGNPESPPARCAVNNQHVKIFDVGHFDAHGDMVEIMTGINDSEKTISSDLFSFA